MSGEARLTNRGDMIIVLGPSVGTVETISMMLSTLPVDLPAAMLVALNLESSRVTNLVTILKQHTRFKLELVDGQHTPQQGTIYFHPAYRRLAIQDGQLELGEDEGPRGRSSIDQLLTNAAGVYGDRLTVVVLAGSGPDGASGIVEVKNAGGLVVVQNPQQARFPSLPVSLPPTAVDAEVHVEQVGPLLHDLLNGLEIPQQGEKSEDLLRRILEHVSRQTNIDFRSYKTSTILRRISRRMATTHCTSLHDYTEYLERQPEEIGELVKAFLINVTQFFRDREAFDYLRAEILPQIIDHARQRDHVLRFWSAGCATGEEPYSLAMLLADMLGGELPEWGIKIFATDLDEEAISFARRGIYSDNLLKGLPDDYAERYFERVDHGYRISKTLRQLVIFGQQDLSRSAPFPRIDLVLCRNLLIYFTPDMQDYILNQFAYSVCPTHGYVLLGKAETVRPNHTYYELVNKHWKIYRCASETLPIPRRPSLADTNQQRVKSPSLRQPLRMSQKALSEPDNSTFMEMSQLRRFNELLLRFLPLGVAVIDRAYRLLSLNPAARRLLSIREGAAEQDFLHAVAMHGIPYADVRSAIDTVYRERRTMTLPELEVKTSSLSNARYLSLSIVPMHAEGENVEFAAICMIDISDQVQIRRRLEAVQAEQSQLVNELSLANKQLNDINKELLDANEEFQVANEELVLTQEELQATVEEFEATNEELQATNEELETNNEELQATNEELQATNDELRSRSVELQDLTGILDGDRLRLAEMIELAPFYILLLQGPNLIVDAYNPRYARLLEGREIRGRPLGEVFDRFWGPDDQLVDLAQSVYQTGKLHTTDKVRLQLPNQPADEETYFTFSIIPTHDGSNKIDGVAIYANDITHQQAQEARAENERLRLIFEHATSVALGLYDAQTSALMLASPRLLELIHSRRGIRPESAIGKSWSETCFALPPEQTAEVWQSCLQRRDRARLQEVQVPAEQGLGTTSWDWSLTPIPDPEHPAHVRFMLLSAVDVTEQVEARHEVERLDQLKTEFLSLVSHELRAPLTPLMGYTEVIGRIAADQERNYNSDKQKRIGQLSGLVSTQLRRMNRLIEDLVDLGRIESGKLALHEEQVDLVRLAQQCAAEARLQTQQPIEVRHPAHRDRLLVWGDPDRLAQVVLNFLRNAIVHAESSERIELQLAQVEQEGAVCAELGVRDYGPGIPRELQATIFKRFVQGADGSDAAHEPGRQGLGLGLYIASQIVQQHGGTMGLASEPGQGSYFFLRLPLIRG